MFSAAAIAAVPPIRERPDRPSSTASLASPAAQPARSDHAGRLPPARGDTGLAPVLLLEVVIDRDRRPGPLRGGDDDELDVAVGVARQEQARPTGSLLAVGAELV